MAFVEIMNSEHTQGSRQVGGPVIFQPQQPRLVVMRIIHFVNKEAKRLRAAVEAQGSCSSPTAVLGGGILSLKFRKAAPSYGMPAPFKFSFVIH